MEHHFSAEALEWFEDGAPSVTAFSCLAFDAIMGKAVKGEIDDPGVLLGELHLPGFVTMNLIELDHRFRSGWRLPFA